MSDSIYYNAADIMQLLGVSRSKSYAIIRKLNSELDAMGYITTAGKVPKKYFAEKVYGM